MEEYGTARQDIDGDILQHVRFASWIIMARNI